MAGRVCANDSLGIAVAPLATRRLTARAGAIRRPAQGKQKPLVLQGREVACAEQRPAVPPRLSRPPRLSGESATPLFQVRTAPAPPDPGIRRDGRGCWPYTCCRANGGSRRIAYLAALLGAQRAVRHRRPFGSQLPGPFGPRLATGFAPCPGSLKARPCGRTSPDRRRSDMWLVAAHEEPDPRGGRLEYGTPPGGCQRR